MPSCIIKGCFNTWKQKDSKVILHVFPKDKEGIKLWLRQSPENFPNVEELVDKIHAQNKWGTFRLCSKHFTDDQYFHEGTKRRLRPHAIPTLFAADILPSDMVGQKGAKRRRKSSSDDLEVENISEGASSNILFYPQTSDTRDTFMQQVSPSHLHIVLPSTSLLAMGKSRMAEKAMNTDAFFNTKCQAVGTYPMFGKKNASCQTKPWKGKSQGTLCNILMEECIKPNQGLTQRNIRQAEKSWSSGMRNTGFTAKPQMGTEQGVNRSTTSTQAIFPNNEKEPHANNRLDHNDGSPSIKAEQISPPISRMESNCGQSSKCSQLISESNESLTDLKSENTSSASDSEDPDEDSETRSSTDDSEKDESSARKPGHFNEPTNEENFTVLKSCLYDLIKLIRCQYRHACNAPLTNVQVKTLGSVIAIDVLCCKGHNSTLWHSQAIKTKTTGGNLLLKSEGSCQQVEPSETKTFFHNFEYFDDLPK
ncbi:uncharacterized protein ACNLHF_011616 [Anomaloglossus baeobatrachus]|uniref:uncharacterized protein LOC142295997 isoform X1 n=1 Tax=Anomaloglossus baeobatrachus TaxID=238106 RepID=UPI003F4F7036